MQTHRKKTPQYYLQPHPTKAELDMDEKKCVSRQRDKSARENVFVFLSHMGQAGRSVGMITESRSPPLFVTASQKSAAANSVDHRQERSQESRW